MVTKVKKWFSQWNLANRIAFGVLLATAIPTFFLWQQWLNQPTGVKLVIEATHEAFILPPQLM